MTNLDSILKSRDITLSTKIRLVKAMVFPVVMYGCESLTIKKAKCWRIDAFELLCWRRLLRVPWTERRSNQSILKETSPVHWKDWCWSWNSNTWPPDVKSWLIGKDSDAGKDWGQEEKGTTENEMVGWHHQLPEFTQTHVHRVGDVIQPSHLLLSPSPPAPNPSQHQGLFQWVSSSHQVAKYWSFSFNISPSNEHPGLISFRMNWLDLLAVQGTLKSLLQHHSSKASILQRSVFFIVQLSPIHDHRKNHSLD